MGDELRKCKCGGFAVINGEVLGYQLICKLCKKETNLYGWDHFGLSQVIYDWNDNIAEEKPRQDYTHALKAAYSGPIW